MTLFTTPLYSGLFVSLSELNNQYRLTEWQFGQPIGHVCFDGFFEAVCAIAELGLRWARVEERMVFDEDVLLTV